MQNFLNGFFISQFLKINQLIFITTRVVLQRKLIHPFSFRFSQYGIKSKEEKEANEKAQREQETAGRVGRQKKTPEEIAAEMNNDTDEGEMTK